MTRASSSARISIATSIPYTLQRRRFSTVRLMDANTPTVAAGGFHGLIISGDMSRPNILKLQLKLPVLTLDYGGWIVPVRDYSIAIKNQHTHSIQLPIFQCFICTLASVSWTVILSFAMHLESDCSFLLTRE